MQVRPQTRAETEISTLKCLVYLLEIPGYELNAYFAFIPNDQGRHDIVAFFPPKVPDSLKPNFILSGNVLQGSCPLGYHWPKGVISSGGGGRRRRI